MAVVVVVGYYTTHQISYPCFSPPKAPPFTHLDNKAKLVARNSLGIWPATRAHIALARSRREKCFTINFTHSFSHPFCCCPQGRKKPEWGGPSRLWPLISPDTIPAEKRFPSSCSFARALSLSLSLSNLIATQRYADTGHRGPWTRPPGTRSPVVRYLRPRRVSIHYIYTRY